MSKERLMTAAELMAKLQADQEYQDHRAEKDRTRRDREKQDAEAFRPYLMDLARLGFNGETIEDVVKKHSPLPGPAIKVFLSSLERISDPRQLETMVRALGASHESFDGRPLVRCFESTSDEGLRWAIANTIVLAHPHSIDEWLSRLRTSPHWSATFRKLGLNT